MPSAKSDDAKSEASPTDVTVTTQTTVSETTPAQDPKAVAADEAALAADISAAHAEVAVERADADAATAQKAADKNRPACPHCGRLLRPEHDLGDHLHCDNAACIACCFEPGADGPVLRANYPPCPSDTTRR